MAFKIADHQQDAVGGSVDLPGRTDAGDREPPLEQRPQQGATKITGNGSASWTLIQQHAEDRCGEAAHDCSLSKPCRICSGVSVRMFRISVSAGNVTPAC